MKHIKIKATFTVSDEFFNSDSFQGLKKDILQNELAKELEMDGDVFDIKITFSVIENK